VVWNRDVRSQKQRAPGISILGLCCCFVSCTIFIYAEASVSDRNEHWPLSCAPTCRISKPREYNVYSAKYGASKIVMEQAAGRWLLVRNVNCPNSPSLYSNSQAVLQNIRKLIVKLATVWCSVLSYFFCEWQKRYCFCNKISVKIRKLILLMLQLRTVRIVPPYPIGVCIVCIWIMAFLLKFVITEFHAEYSRRVARI
jgi:hypothetical protein